MSDRIKGVGAFTGERTFVLTAEATRAAGIGGYGDGREAAQAVIWKGFRDAIRQGARERGLSVVDVYGKSPRDGSTFVQATIDLT